MAYTRQRQHDHAVESASPSSRSFDWQADGYGIEFHLSHGDMLRVLRANGFEILNLIELAAPAAAEDHSYYDFVPAAWAKQWPAEEIWVARKHPS